MNRRGLRASALATHREFLTYLEVSHAIKGAREQQQGVGPQLVVGRFRPERWSVRHRLITDANVALFRPA